MRYFDYIVSLLRYIAIVRNPPCELNLFVLQQQQNLGGTGGVHLPPPPPPRGGFGCCPFRGGGSVVVDSLLIVTDPLWDSVIVLCFVVRYFVSILLLQSSQWGRESWLLCFVCLPGVS